MKSIPVEEIKNKVFEEIPLSQIREVSNVRRVYKSETIEELSLSIEKSGLVEPLIIKKEKNSFLLVDGHRRLRALKRLYADTQPNKLIPCFIYKGDFLTAQIITSIHKEELNDIDTENALMDIMKQEHINNYEELSQLINKSVSWIKHKMRAAKVRQRTLNEAETEKEQEEINSLSSTAIEELSKLSQAEISNILNKLNKEGKDKTKKNIRKEIKEQKEERISFKIKRSDNLSTLVVLIEEIYSYLSHDTFLFKNAVQRYIDLNDMYFNNIFYFDIVNQDIYINRNKEELIKKDDIY